MTAVLMHVGIQVSLLYFRSCVLNALFQNKDAKTLAAFDH
jgi:hypothetical protein